MTKYPCPKCGSNHSWFEKDGDDLIQRCLCGLTKYLFRELEDGTTIMCSGVRTPDITVPAKGTKIHRCLMAVRNAYPRSIQTGKIVEVTGLQGKETASLVVTLMGRGLLERVVARRGLLGGSVWKLTAAAQTLLKVDKGVDEYGFSIGDDAGAEFLLGQHTGRSGEHSDANEEHIDSTWFDLEEGDYWN